MSAYLVTLVTAQDLDWVDEYLKNVPAIVKRHGGKYLAVSKGVPGAVHMVEGSAQAPDGFAILQFLSMESLERFLSSSEYAPYKKARIAATHSTFFAFEADADAPQLRDA